ncbi:hypothetical protein GCM10010832_16220 [Psychroflexus planctonicus]|uniref:Uncharacterized protein n=1 Tax=Psychroflexus planctonicus TaxID=1526575 RepID=A0ABQ1SFI8_9FLAO|nr:hypothetical protein GCM10010832_16220 [Psychroflexus planctonicus]
MIFVLILTLRFLVADVEITTTELNCKAKFLKLVLHGKSQLHIEFTKSQIETNFAVARKIA